MEIDEILSQWKEDAQIDSNELGAESNKIPQLHAKYLDIMSHERRKLKHEKQKLKTLEFDKYEFFSGRMPTEKLKEKGWKPFPHKILKNEIDKYIESDKEVVSQKLYISDLQEKVETLESIIDQINKRTFVIKNSIEWLRFTNGIS